MLNVEKAVHEILLKRCGMAEAAGYQHILKKPGLVLAERDLDEVIRRENIRRQGRDEHERIRHVAQKVKLASAFKKRDRFLIYPGLVELIGPLVREIDRVIVSMDKSGVLRKLRHADALTPGKGMTTAHHSDKSEGQYLLRLELLLSKLLFIA